MFLNTNIVCRPNFVLLFIFWTNLAPYDMNWHIIFKHNIFYPSENMRTPWASWHFLCKNFMWAVSCSLEYSHTYIETLRKLVPNMFPKLLVRLEFEDEAWELNLCKLQSESPFAQVGNSSLLKYWLSHHGHPC